MLLYPSEVLWLSLREYALIIFVVPTLSLLITSNLELGLTVPIPIRSFGSSK